MPPSRDILDPSESARRRRHTSKRFSSPTIEFNGSNLKEIVKSDPLKFWEVFTALATEDSELIRSSRSGGHELEIEKLARRLLQRPRLELVLCWWVV